MNATEVHILITKILEKHFKECNSTYPQFVLIAESDNSPHKFFTSNMPEDKAKEMLRGFSVYLNSSLYKSENISEEVKLLVKSLENKNEKIHAKRLR